MKPYPVERNRHGFTLTELIVVVVVVAGLALLVLRHFARAQVGGGMSCVNNLKQVGLAFRLWAGDNNDRFPMVVPVDRGGTRELIPWQGAWMHYLVMSNELSTPKVLRCPLDKERTAADAFDLKFGNQNLSYFVGMEAEEAKPNMILSGDRNLTSKGQQIGSGVFEFQVGNDVKAAGWSETLHKHQGNLGMADGSVQQVSETRLQEALEKSGTNRFMIP